LHKKTFSGKNRKKKGEKIPVRPPNLADERTLDAPAAETRSINPMIAYYGKYIIYFAVIQG